MYIRAQPINETYIDCRAASTCLVVVRFFLLECGAVCLDGSVHEPAVELVRYTSRAESGTATYEPPTMDIAHAAGRMISECARTRGRAKPVTTIVAVMKQPRSIGPEPS